VRLAALLAALTLVACVALVVPGRIVVNRTGSMPLGTYVMLPLVAPKIGDIVLACLDDDAVVAARRAGVELVPGRCPNGAPALLKVVVALPGARARVDDTGVTIDGERLGRSRPVAGRLRRAAAATVCNGCAWLWSPVAASFDSRYIGPQRVSSVVYPIDPISTDQRRQIVPRFSVQPLRALTPAGGS
jgi:conjugative transfer signal peptidase TraF